MPYNHWKRQDNPGILQKDCAMNFDKNGYLIPYDLIPADLATIESVLVEPFSVSFTRRRLFNAFTGYLAELQEALNAPLEIWVNSSFTTLKPNPNDVDFVIFVDKAVADAHKETIFQFRQRRYAKKLPTDGYFIEIVPEGHPDYGLYQSDRQDWHRAFVFGRDGRKGYLQIIL